MQAFVREQSNFKLNAKFNWKNESFSNMVAYANYAHSKQNHKVQKQISQQFKTFVN